MNAEDKELSNNYEILNKLPHQTESKKNVIENLKANTILIEEKDEINDENAIVLKSEHFPRNAMKSVTQKINTKDAKKMFMLKRQMTINCKITSPEKLEKIYNMTENDLDGNNLLIRKNKSNSIYNNLNINSSEKLEEIDSDVSEDEFSESKAKEILLQNRSIKVKQKTIKKMTIVFKRTANLIKKKVSQIFIITILL